MTKEAREYFLQNGTIEGYYTSLIKRNDKGWFILICLMCVIFIGMYCEKPKVIVLDNSKFYQKKVDSLQNYVDTCFAIPSYKPEQR